MELTRFYLQLKEDPHGPNVALFVGNLPPNLSQIQYEKILLDYLDDGKWINSRKCLSCTEDFTIFFL